MRPDFLTFSSMEILTYSHLAVEFSILLKNLQSIPNRLWFIVISLNKILSCLIILASNLWGIEDQVINTSTSGMNPSVLNSFNDSFKWNTEINNNIYWCLLLKSFRLSLGSWESIQKPRFLT